MTLFARDAPHDSRAKLFGGRNTVRVWNLASSPLVAPFTTALACELEADGFVGLHRQEHDPEIVIVLEGSGQATVSGRPIALAPGTLISLPLGELLSIENLSKEAPLRYLIVKARQV